MNAELALLALPEYRKAERQVEILEDPDVRLGRLAIRVRFAGDFGNIEDAVGEGDDFHEAREVAEPAHQTFALNFLPDVESDVGGQRRIGRIGIPDDGQHASPEGQRQVEGGQFRRHERVHPLQQQSAREQVDARSPQLAGRGTGEHEPRRRPVTAPFDEVMDDIEQCRNPLHFVEDDDLRLQVAVDEIPEPVGTRREALMDLRLQEIDPEPVGERFSQKGGLAGTAGTEQEVTGFRRMEKTPYEFRLCCCSGRKTTKTAANRERNGKEEGLVERSASSVCQATLGARWSALGGGGLPVSGNACQAERSRSLSMTSICGSAFVGQGKSG